MNKENFKKLMDSLYKPSSKKVEVLDVPNREFLMIDGKGSPDSQEFQEAVGALYSVAYGIKMLHKKESCPPDYFEYTVPPLEGIWYSQNSSEIELNSKDNWAWTLMIMQPDFVTLELFEDVRQEVIKKKKISMLNKVRFQKFGEGLCAQIMHIGSYAEETPTVEKIIEFNRQNGYEVSGKHHEIYIGDPRRTGNDKLKTIIRYPIRKLVI